MNSHMCNDSVTSPNKKIWKAKIPLKIKIFMWLINQNAILTKDNLSRIKWQGDVRCKFFEANESIPHLFFECSTARYVRSMVAMVVGAPCRPVSFNQFWIWVNIYLKGGKKYFMVGLGAICWAIWKARNDICFDKKLIRSPTEIICTISSFLTYWTDLQAQEDKDALEGGAEALKKMALHLHPHQAAATMLG